MIINVFFVHLNVIKLFLIIIAHVLKGKINISFITGVLITGVLITGVLITCVLITRDLVTGILITVVLTNGVLITCTVSQPKFAKLLNFLTYLALVILQN